ncbi:hypothetical protein [Paraburkholderia sp. SIMBA_054]|uniref:hypothetical protein n=1 Tax=Paraburkholderia sp. SIMBA_054 TaxID=3085795 RepID=UPI003978D0C8
MSEILPEGSITNILARELGTEPPEAGQATNGQRDPAAGDEAEQVYNELKGAYLASGSDLEAGIKMPAVQRREGNDAELTQEEIRALRDKLMARAAKQRKQGVANLKRSEAGVAALEFTARIKSRGLSSAFQRWFSAIDQCAGNLQRRGEMLLGDKAALLIDSLTTQIEHVEKEALAEVSRVGHLVKQAKENDISNMFVEPRISTPALEMDVAIHSKLGMRLYRALRNYDDALEMMNVLVWNDEMDEDAQKTQEFDYKKSFGGLYRFAARTNINIYSRFTKRRAATPRPANDAGAPAPEQEPLDKAA